MAGAGDAGVGPGQPLEAPAVALYEQRKRQISELVLLGRWAPGTVLPGEMQLAPDAQHLPCRARSW